MGNADASRVVVFLSHEHDSQECAEALNAMLNNSGEFGTMLKERLPRVSYTIVPTILA